MQQTPWLSSVLFSCGRLETTLAFFVEQLGLSAGAIRERPPTLPGQSIALRAEAEISIPWEDDEFCLHLVEPDSPGEPVRCGAGRHDACVKTINFLCRDLPSIVTRLRGRGCVFHSDWVEYEKRGVTYRDVHMQGPDASNIGLLEILDAAYETNEQGIGPVAAVCLTTVQIDDAARVARILEMHQALDESFAGEAIEMMLGLPSGASLQMQLFGPEIDRARLELVSYCGAGGENLHPLTRLPATGMILPRVRVDDLSLACSRLAENGLQVSPLARGEILGSHCESALVTTGEGLMIELLGEPQLSAAE